MTGVQATDTVAIRDHVRQLVAAVERATAPNGSLCVKDGCLLIAGDACPACQVRAAARICDCGTQIRRLDVDSCSECRKKVSRRPCAGCSKWVRKAGEDRCSDCRSLVQPRPLCACGRKIRAADQDTCSPCRRKERRNTVPDEPDRCPVGWVRRTNSLIWQPVYDQSEVA